MKEGDYGKGDVSRPCRSGLPGRNTPDRCITPEYGRYRSEQLTVRIKASLLPPQILSPRCRHAYERRKQTGRASRAITDYMPNLHRNPYTQSSTQNCLPITYSPMAHTSSDVGVVPGAPPQLGVPPTVVEAAITPTLPMPQDLGTMDLTTIKGFFEVMNKDSPNLTYGGKGPVYKALGIDSGRVYALKIAEWDLDGSEDLHNLSKEFQIHSEFDAKGGHKNVAEFVFGNENNLSLPAEASESWKTTRGKKRPFLYRRRASNRVPVVLITEYLYGGTLYQIAKNLRPNGMKEEEVKHVLGEIGSGVQV